MEQCSGQTIMRNESVIDGTEKWKSATLGAPNSADDNVSKDFDCNICLDCVRDPVVTLCGHLYCWPCIYKWIHCQRFSLESQDNESKCPVCKAEVSESMLIPLYGRGEFMKASDGKSKQIGPVIPQRPANPPCEMHTMVATSTSSRPNPHLHHNSYPGQPYYPYLGDYSSSASFGLAGTSTFQPMIGMFGEMIYARIFGNSHTSLYSYPNTYALAGSSNARVRRRVMQVDRSLSRVSFFLCCCVVLCLLLF